MKLNELKPAPGAKKARRRVGRGVGSGRGKTAGRGQKGQKSRSGFSLGAGFEGGRSRLIMRLPKRGFNRQKAPVQIVNLHDLNVFDDGTVITAELLAARGLVRKADLPVKLLANGELTAKKLVLELDAYSRRAVEAVQAAGGTVNLAPAEEESAAPAETASEETE